MVPFVSQSGSRQEAKNECCVQMLFIATSINSAAEGHMIGVAI